MTRKYLYPNSDVANLPEQSEYTHWLKSAILPEICGLASGILVIHFGLGILDCKQSGQLDI